MNKRHRGRGRKQNSNNPNRSLDSNGPDVKIRGSANTIYDKYTTLARDASSSGHRVKAENYLQHAEHYLRLLTEQQAKAAEQQAAQQQARQQNDDQSTSEQNSDENQSRSNGRSRRYPARRRQPVNNEAQNNDKNGEAAEASKDKGEAMDGNAKPKKTSKKKSVEALTDAPPKESVSSAAE